MIDPVYGELTREKVRELNTEPATWICQGCGERIDGTWQRLINKDGTLLAGPWHSPGCVPQKPEQPTDEAEKE